MPETNFFWDPLSDNILQERDDAGAVTAEYTTEPGLYGNLVSQNRSGVEIQHHFDALGSALALSDDNQQVTDTYAYTAFGELTEHSGSTVNPFQYVGQKGYSQDDLTGQYVVRRRTIDPVDARWLSTDPIEFVDGQNLYRYVGGEASIYVDPSGLLKVLPIPGEQQLGHLQCGDLSYINWDFVLDKPAPCNGYIVQRIEVRCDIALCGTVPQLPYPGFHIPIVRPCPNQSPATPQKVIWEAWPVEYDPKRVKGRMWYARDDGSATFTDQSSIQIYVPPLGTCGNVSFQGTIKFYCMDKNDRAAKGVGTGHLGDSDVQPLDPQNADWGPRKVYSGGDCPRIYPGGLPSTDKPPRFWTKPPVEGTAYRSHSVYWKCCTCPPEFVDASAQPQ